MPWDWRRDQAIIDQAMDDDGFVQPGRHRKPAWVLRLLRLFDGHPFYRNLDAAHFERCQAQLEAEPTQEGPNANPTAEGVLVEAVQQMNLATESASAGSASSTAAADHQEVDALVFVCDPERAPLPSANAETDAVQQCFASHGRRAAVQRGGDAKKLRELLERHRPHILHLSLIHI